MTSEQLREHGNWHEHKAQSCADQGKAIGIVAAATGIVGVVFILTDRMDLMLWALGIQLTMALGQQWLLKRFKHHANAALGCFIEAELLEEQPKRRTHE